MNLIPLWVLPSNRQYSPSSWRIKFHRVHVGTYGPPFWLANTSKYKTKYNFFATIQQIFKFSCEESDHQYIYIYIVLGNENLELIRSLFKNYKIYWSRFLWCSIHVSKIMELNLTCEYIHLHALETCAKKQLKIRILDKCFYCIVFWAFDALKVHN